MSSERFVEQVDAAIGTFFASGNSYTIVLAGLLVLTLLWPILTGKDPDIHPFLLARQAQASPVRQPGESAVYRATGIAYGYPLRKGLGVKDPGTPAWNAGRDGDLRDVWRKAAQGSVDEKGVPTGQKGKFLTILGRQKVVEESIDQVTQTINAIGRFIQEKGGKTVAVSLPNSIELMAAIFASAFYDFKLVLLPYGLDQTQLQALLSRVRADVLVAEAATADLAAVLAVAPSIRNAIWVVQEGNRHIDWTDKPEGVGQIEIYQWHDLVNERKGHSEVPALEKGSTTSPIATSWKNKEGQYELVEYTSEALIAGVAGLLSTLQRDRKLTPQDIVLSTASLTESYALCWVLAALYSNASIALNSVAGDSVDFTMATVGVSPTMIIASSGTVTQHHEKMKAVTPGLPQKISDYFQKSNLRSGYMSDKKPGSIAPNLSALRLLLVSQRDVDRDRVPSSMLAGLRLALGARVACALTTASVAGAVSQTNILDYREKGDDINLGAPLPSVELYLTGEEHLLDRDLPEGKITVRGPAVLGGTSALDVTVRIDNDRTIHLL